MVDAPVMLQVGQHAIDQQEHALAPDPGPKPSVPRGLGQLTDEVVGQVLAAVRLADRRRLLGAEHPDTLSSANNLADAYWAAGAGNPVVRADPHRLPAAARRGAPPHEDCRRESATGQNSDRRAAASTLVANPSQVGSGFGVWRLMQNPLRT
jgi:hypothetical protein